MRLRGDTALLLGAGFSRVAGFPLTRDLFDANALPPAKGKQGVKQHQAVRQVFEAWHQINPTGNAEHFLQEQYRLTPAHRPVPWEWTLRYALARLTDLKSCNGPAPYYYGISTSIRCHSHRLFWQQILNQCDVSAIVTTNYDLLIEQGCRECYTDSRSAPLCFYGGRPVPQVIRIMEDVVKRKSREVRLDHSGIPLYKLHGSLNWAAEHQEKIHDDVRAVFRTTDRDGIVRVVPPLPEKDRPDWLADVWAYAKRDLGRSRRWIVCGYSLPSYDEAICEMLRQAVAQGSLRQLVIADPAATRLAEHYADLLAFNGDIIALPGLPDVLEHDTWREVMSYGA